MDREPKPWQTSAAGPFLRDTQRVMSPQHVTASALELTRRAFLSANDNDYAAMMVFYGPDSLWDMSRWGLGTYEGLAAIRRFFEDWMGSFDRYQVVAEEMRDLGNGVVFAVGTQYAHTARTRGHLQLRSASVFVWADGVAIRVTHYRDIDEARAAAERLTRGEG
jgi:ketosteroid isomerase-like protein